MKLCKKCLNPEQCERQCVCEKVKRKESKLMSELSHLEADIKSLQNQMPYTPQPKMSVEEIDDFMATLSKPPSCSKEVCDCDKKECKNPA